MTQACGVVFEGVSKAFNDVRAVDGVSLDVRQGEFFSLLGPSGGGKTTSLRLIAGFERPDAGRIRIGDADVTETPPHKRPVNTVFQSYALFPHLSVGENVAFGLRFTDLSKQEKQRRVGEMLELVELTGYERRKPHQLSGGQQQRVALARALILNPALLLLDEPLGALDAKLRRGLQIELKNLQREVGITFVYVTHDQEEALTMSDRLAVMAAGRIEQLGSPKDVYENPATPFVADFLGVSNLMTAECDGRGGISLGGGTLTVEAGAAVPAGEVMVAIRPERIEIELLGGGTANRVRGTVTEIVYVGPTMQVNVTLDGGQAIQSLITNTGRDLEFARGDAVAVHLPADALRVLLEDPAGSPV